MTAETKDQAATIDSKKPGFAISLLGAALPGLYLLITSTTTLVAFIWPYDYKRMLEFGLLLVLFLMAAISRPIRDEFTALLGTVPRWVGLTLITVFGWGIVSAIVNARSGMHLANSLSEVALLGSLVLAAFVVGACRRISKVAFDRLAVGLLALLGLAVGVQELMGVLAAHAGGVDFSFRVSLLHFSWPRFYNQVQSWTVPVIAALPLLFSGNRLARILCLLALTLHWYVIFVTGARGSFVALASALLLGLALLPSARALILRWHIPGILLGAALYGVVLYSFQAMSPSDVGPAAIATGPAPAQTQAVEPAKKVSETKGDFLGQSVGKPLLDPTGRMEMWRVTVRDARAHPILGIGPMNYVCTSRAHIGHPHNFPLQLAAEWGLPVAVAVSSMVVVLVLLGIGRLRRTDRRHRDRAMPALLTMGIIAAGIHACVSGVLVMPASQVAGLIIVGLLLGVDEDVETESPKGRFIPALPLALLGLASTIALISLGAVELKTMAERAVYLQPGEDLRPRIWQNAKVCRLYVDERPVTN